MIYSHEGAGCCQNFFSWSFSFLNRFRVIVWTSSFLFYFFNSVGLVGLFKLYSSQINFSEVFATMFDSEYKLKTIKRHRNNLESKFMFIILYNWSVSHPLSASFFIIPYFEYSRIAKISLCHQLASITRQIVFSPPWEWCRWIHRMLKLHNASFMINLVII